MPGFDWRQAAPGGPIIEVRDLPGHRRLKMTERYAHLAPETVRAAVTLLEGHESRLSHVGDESRDERERKSLI
jgi:hypothetical protein